MDLSVLFVGTGGSVPSAQRAPTSLLVARGGDRMLLDCGEGTQRQLLRSTGLIELREVFVTHYHADHYLGLPGMLKTFDLRGRTEPLHVYGPPGLQDLFKALRRIFGRLSFPLELVELEPGEALDRDGYRLATYPTQHSVKALGYCLVEEDRPGRFDIDRARELGVPEGPAFGELQRGAAVEVGGREVTPDDVLGEPRPGRKLVFTGDTMACEATRVAAHGADLLVHDGTFGHEESERAHETGHSTAREAAEVASQAEVGLLALTHLSTRYHGGELEEEARAVFPAAVVPRDLDVVELPFAERGKPELVRRKG